MASSRIPSYEMKLDRAERHFEELKDAIARFGGSEKTSRAYTIRKSREGKRDVHRLHFRRSVINTDIPLITADAIYNLRSSLEHLMTAMSPKGRSPIFPIFFRGVEQPAPRPENEQRTKERERWISDTRGLDPGAVEFLRRLQPPGEPNHAQEPHPLRLLNQLSNKDRHTRLPLVANGVEDLITDWRMPDGEILRTVGLVSQGHIVLANAKLSDVPKGAEYLECIGTVHVAIQTPLRNENGIIYLPVINFIADELNFIRGTVIPGLAPYVRR